ncbi:MAG: hypothetical protein AXA67_13725 [Methylothermaceae bacteria B42]|nr:MAG: hypothetical protein AXA67_13725 [Methylothermaceae bacteria B42]HHJ38314.1 TetR/AcrR family transcriptional regulator [Methylothermaceae bacterium]
MVMAQAKKKSDKKEPNDEILKAALKLFTQKGYFNTSVADIRREADVSTGTIYHYFKNKEAIADALYQDIITSLNESIKEIKNKTKNSFERLRAIVELFFTLTEDAADVMGFIIMAHHQEFLPNEKPLSMSPPFLLLTEIMKEGIKAGELRRMDPVVANACFYGTTARMIQLRLENALDKPLDWYLLDTWTAIWKALSP